MLDTGREQLRLLSRFGLGPDAEDLYLGLVTRPAADTTDLVGTTGWQPHRVRSALTLLATHGLVEPLDEDRYRARAPELAFRDHLARRQQELEDDRASVQRLADIFRRAAAVRDATEIVQVVTGREALAAVIRDLQESARHEVRSLVKPPVIALPAAENRDAQLHWMAQGVRYRTVYDRAMLSRPLEADLLQTSLSAGELMKVSGDVPVKMMMADTSRAVLPLDRGADEEPVGVVIRHHSLISVLDALFERVWAAANPIPSRHEPQGETGAESERPGQDGPSPDDVQMVALLVAGLPDRALAAHLGVSKRTVERRIRKLLDRTGAGSRIQLGLHASREGWI